jgi:glycosyltransferase involved in cell wall biosynthesis
MSSLRILQVLPELNMGGVERVTLDMVAALREITPTTFVASQGGALVVEVEKLGGIHFHLPLASKNPYRIVKNGVALARLIRKHEISLVHARSRAPAWSCLIATRLAKVPFITTYHGAYNSTNILKTFYNSIMTRGDRVIAISEFIKKTILQHHPKTLPRIRIIPEGIDTDKFNPQKVTRQEIEEFKNTWGIPENATVFLVPGRVTRIKGQLVFLDALRRLNNPNLFGVILGINQDNSSYPAQVRQQSQDLPIKLIPFHAKPMVAYAAADFVVSPSLAQEAFGRVTAEAGAMERVIIATNHGATTELCLPGKTGFLVPPGDSKALAETMIHAIKMSPEDLQAMGKAARSYICERYSLKRMSSETIDLYKELI